MGISIAVTVGNATKQADVAGIRGRGVKRASIEFDADSAGRHGHGPEGGPCPGAG